MLYATIGPRMVMAGAGGINHEELCDLTTKHFGKIGHTYDAEIPLDLNCRYTGMLITLSYSITTLTNLYQLKIIQFDNFIVVIGSDVRVRDDGMPFAHVAIAIEGCGWTNPDNIPLMVSITNIYAKQCL